MPNTEVRAYTSKEQISAIVKRDVANSTLVPQFPCGEKSDRPFCTSHELIGTLETRGDDGHRVVCFTWSKGCICDFLQLDRIVVDNKVVGGGANVTFTLPTSRGAVSKTFSVTDAQQQAYILCREFNFGVMRPIQIEVSLAENEELKESSICKCFFKAHYCPLEERDALLTYYPPHGVEIANKTKEPQDMLFASCKEDALDLFLQI